MITFTAPIKLKLPQENNPYYQYAKPDTETIDKGWKAVFIGSEGADYIFGDDFSDTMYGNGGNDGLHGGGGRDFLYGGEGDDTFIGGEGADEMFGEAGDDFFWGELDGNKIDGGSGHDTISYSGMDKGIVVSLRMGGALNPNTFTVREYITDIESVIGTSHDDAIVGDDRLIGNHLFGGAGNDVLEGGGGTDTIVGGLGADILLGGTESDTFAFNLGDSPGGTSNFDTIRDFDLDDDILQFQVYDPNLTDWSAYETTVDGVAGTWVRITELQLDGPVAETQVRYEVFLAGTNLETVGADDFAFV